MLHTWADDFNSYADACRYYGADTPEQIEAEMADLAAEQVAWLAEMEAAFGPYALPPMECPF